MTHKNNNNNNYQDMGLWFEDKQVNKVTKWQFHNFTEDAYGAKLKAIRIMCSGVISRVAFLAIIFQIVTGDEGVAGWMWLKVIHFIKWYTGKRSIFV